MKTQLNIDYQSIDTKRHIEIVLSLQDRAYELIKSGVKKLEFRKRWRNGPCVAYIYRSGKKKEISAYMKLGDPIYGTPGEIGQLAENMMPGNGAAVEEYLISSHGGYAIPIESFYEFQPIPLAELRMIGFHPPQYFFYLSNHPKIKRLLEDRIND